MYLNSFKSISLVLLIFKLKYINAVTKLGNCEAELDDGQIIDLKSLTKKLTTASPLWSFEYIPCGELDCGTIKSAVCQKYPPSINYPIGSLNSVQFSLTNKDLVMSYSGSGGSSTIQCLCSDDLALKYLSETNNNYLMLLSDPCCCPGRCSNKSNSLSGGSVLLIIFFVILTLYLITGAVYNKVYKKSNGIELVPNLTFWSSLVVHIKEGFSLSVSKLKSLGGENRNYQQI